MAKHTSRSSMHRVCSALLLLPLLLAVAEAVSLQQSLQQHMQHAFQQSFGGLQARVATAAADPSNEYDSYGGESVAQLAETGQSNCRPLGCGACGNGGEAGYAWTSRFTCVQHDGYGGYSYGHNKLGRHTFTQVMGECNWEFVPYQPVGGAAVCPWVLVNGQTWRIGSASGRCTFPGGDQCGEPLCSTLRVTIDGDVYATSAYTQSSTTTPTTGIQDADCQAVLDWTDLPGLANCNLGLGPRLAGPRTGNPGNRTEPPQQLNNPAASIYDVSTANYGGYGSYGGGGTAANYYPATAIVISGTVTSQSGQKHGCYSEGTIEYVPYVFVDAAAVAVPCPPGAVVVSSQDITIGFTKNSCGYS